MRFTALLKVTPARSVFVRAQALLLQMPVFHRRTGPLHLLSDYLLLYICEVHFLEPSSPRWHFKTGNVSVCFLRSGRRAYLVRLKERRVAAKDAALRLTDSRSRGCSEKYCSLSGSGGA